MRIIDILGHFQIPVSLEESVFLQKIEKNIARSDLSEREQVLADCLVRRGVLIRQVTESDTFFTINTMRKR